jgi:hypothetical protein
MKYLEDLEDFKPELNNIDQWKLDLLALNPEYCSWGPYEDSMIVNNAGWRSPAFFESWENFGPWGLDSYNECVNFYFEIDDDDRSLALILWWLHPRKGASRGIEIKNIQECDRPAVIDFLKEAAQRNADRFSKVTAIS